MNSDQLFSEDLIICFDNHDNLNMYLNLKKILPTKRPILRKSA